MITEQLQSQEGLSEVERAIVAYFLEAGDALRGQSARSIAAKLYTAPSTVSRLCQRLGFDGYPSFRDAYLDELTYLSSAFENIDANQPFRKRDDCRTIAAKLGALYRETVDDTLALVETEALQRATDLLDAARLTFVYSAGTQASLAEDFADKMGRIGRRVVVSQMGDIAYNYGRHLNADEVFVVLSYSGETPATVRVAEQVRAAGGSLIGITSFGNNRLAELSDVVLRVSTREKLVEKLGSYAMNVSCLLLFDTLYSCVFARDYERNAIERARTAHDYERQRDSRNPILHDRRE